MAENNATCSICDRGYHVCLSCRDSIKANPWKIHTDTAEHYKVYQIIHGLSTGVYTKDEAKIKLKNVDLSDLNTFRPHIKKLIKDILKEEKPAVMTVEQVQPIQAEVKEAESNTVIVKPVISRKRNYKVDVE